jgi:hypothetical protein
MAMTAAEGGGGSSIISISSCSCSISNIATIATCTEYLQLTHGRKQQSQVLRGTRVTRH